jgi:hypothetical protein
MTFESRPIPDGQIVSLEPMGRSDIKATDKRDARQLQTLPEGERQLIADSTCFQSASAVLLNHPGARRSWTLRAPGQEKFELSDALFGVNDRQKIGAARRNRRIGGPSVAPHCRRPSNPSAWRCPDRPYHCFPAASVICKIVSTGARLSKTRASCPYGVFAHVPRPASVNLIAANHWLCCRPY